MEQYKNKNGKYPINPEKLFSNKMIHDTVKYQKQYDFEIGKDNSTWNNEADAFKHAYMQATLALRVGQNIAKFLGDRHEQEGSKKGQPSGEDNMDRWNNQKGREIAEEIYKEYGSSIILKSPDELGNIIAKKVIDKMKSGELITNPDDVRKFTESNHIYTREEINKMTTDEFAKHENAIMKQLREKGIPTKSQLQKHNQKSSAKNSANSNDGRWVTINGNHVLIKD